MSNVLLYRETKEMSKKDAEWSRGNKMWLAGAGLATVAYLMISGQYITISTGFGYEEEDDEAVE
jgi:hypothetical protein